MKLKNVAQVVHGQSRKSKILETNRRLFKNLPSEIMVGRYHSWVIEPETISENFQVTSTDEDENIMSIRHKYLPIYAVQFHPESVLTPQGKEIVKNWIDTKA